jgi:hypothetical protein
MNARKVAAALSRFEVIAYRPTGAVLRAILADFGEVESAIRAVRYDVRNTHGFTPDIKVWMQDATTAREVTHWWRTA